MSIPATASFDWARISAANLSTADFTTAPIPTITAPTVGSGVIAWRGAYTPAQREAIGAGGVSPNAIIFMPYGTGADNTTFDMRLYSWNLITDLWVPTLILNLSCTLSTCLGVAGKTIDNTNRFADTITAAVAPSTAEIISPASLGAGTANIGGYVMVDGLGGQYLQFPFVMTGATVANVIYRMLLCPPSPNAPVVHPTAHPSPTTPAATAISTRGRRGRYRTRRGEVTGSSTGRRGGER